ncbi:pilus assembly protein [Burkholderia sp. FERM BP-3421]|jgi:Flp pilus assembly protein TadG|uniref:TadE/TadG family type IV pilus assembly protein n=1 Tax=Burkholderia sp. FERM BP-3421 TaxID=1494466 RepID=UPI0023620E0C|nr:TadE/TadG family type IV pilus assembly protein [Burkholderia sp. FERM BP-3421]WDD94368.1 pilus assembly protein [Burkholderia sp. FERM BP-3421]
MKPAITPRLWSRRQRGATAVEFAILFPLFFVIFYAIVTYGMIFAAQQSLTLAATEGARAALNYQVATTPTAALGLRATAACTAANGLTGWLSTNATCTSVAQQPCSFDATMYCVQVTITYPYASSPLVPTIALFTGALPTTLTSQATVEINPATII